MTTNDSRIKCRFCDWSMAKAYTTKGKKFRGTDSAHARLIAHVFKEHPEEYQKVQAMLAEEDTDA